jgi:TonB family protein
MRNRVTRNLKRLIIAGSLLCLVSGFTNRSGAITTAAVSNADVWQRYTVKGEEFSVEFPALPAMQSGTSYSLSLRKNSVRRVLGSYGSGVVYVIHTLENVEQQSLDTFIETQKNYYRDEFKAPETSISVNNFVGKQLEFTKRGLPGTVQFFATRTHLYMFEAVGAAGDDPRVRQFFSSLVLGDKTLGIEVQDGIGAQPVVEDPADENPPSEITVRTVDRRAVVVSKPEPSYTESARQGRITGTVVLRLVFASNGSVTNIRVLSSLPFGLTEQSITAARRIRFVPAVKDGRFVSLWTQLEYNFNVF